jgi:hypothetical protein
MLQVYRYTDTTTDGGHIAWRESLTLPKIPVDQISLVNEQAICYRALLAFNQLFVRAKNFHPMEAVSVIRYGSTRFIVGHPRGPMGGEWIYEPVFDSLFRKVAIAGR